MNSENGTNVQKESNVIKQTMPNHKMRRQVQKFQGVLKAKREASFNEWVEFVKEIQKAGEELHKSNMDARESYLSERYDQIMESVIKNWKSLGYNDSEIEMLREAYALINRGYSSTWKADKKRARSLMKDAENSKKSRLVHG